TRTCKRARSAQSLASRPELLDGSCNWVCVTRFRRRRCLCEGPGGSLPPGFLVADRAEIDGGEPDSFQILRDFSRQRPERQGLVLWRIVDLRVENLLEQRLRAADGEAQPGALRDFKSGFKEELAGPGRRLRIGLVTLHCLSGDAGAAKRFPVCRPQHGFGREGPLVAHSWASSRALFES